MYGCRAERGKQLCATAGENVVLSENEIQFRVRYQETDAQGRVHHANYVTYFEMGRTELLRSQGLSYRQLEEEGFYLVVAGLEIKYFSGAKYDDLLRLVTRTVRLKGATVEHQYEVYCEEQLLVEGKSRLGCVDKNGRVQRLPELLCGGAIQGDG